MLQAYLLIDMPKYFKFLMTKFRFGVTDLNVHRSRNRYYTNVNLNCQLCHNGIENEIHFVLCCPFYNELRQELIAPKYWRSPNGQKLKMLFSNTNEIVIKKLCMYVCKALKAREIALS